MYSSTPWETPWWPNWPSIEKRMGAAQARITWARARVGHYGCSTAEFLCQCYCI